MEPNPYDAPAETAVDGSASFDRRWLAAIPFVAVVMLFATLPLMLTLLALLACNAVAFIALLVARQTTAANLAFLTGVLVVASLMFTNWGFSMPNPRVTVSWVCLIPALIAQLALIACPFWLPLTQRIGGSHGFSARPRLRLWSIVWFAGSFAPLVHSGLQYRGHRLFGNVISFW